MKRVGNLYSKIISIENLELADVKASKGKSKQRGVIHHNKNKEENILKLHESLVNKTFVTSEYSTFIIYEPKEREIFRLPYYPDRILHHAVMNILEPIFVSTFTADTYSCIKGRGIHKAFYNLKKALKDKENVTYCLKLDVKKFFPNIDHEVLKSLLRRKFKDNDLLELLDEIIDSTPGLPIGNYLSSCFANYYMTYFDHWIKELKGVKYFFRYCDDLVILHSDKAYLHELRGEIVKYLQDNLNLSLKANYQLFKVESRGIDFVGYKSYLNYTRLRKRIKNNFIRMIKTNRNEKSINSYYGWMVHCDGRNLFKKYTDEKVCSGVGLL
jgi:RNA-directed DNA polymerase